MIFRQMYQLSNIFSYIQVSLTSMLLHWPVIYINRKMYNIPDLVIKTYKKEFARFTSTEFTIHSIELKCFPPQILIRFDDLIR